MRILFKGSCRLSLVWIAKQCGWSLVSSSSIINWWKRLSRKVKGLCILFGSDTKSQPGWVTPACRYPPWHPFHEEVSKERWIEKKPKTCKCCYAMIASGNLSCDQSGCFCRPMLHVVYLSLYLDSSKWACSMLEGWKISASSHLLCSPIFHLHLK